MKYSLLWERRPFIQIKTKIGVYTLGKPHSILQSFFVGNVRFYTDSSKAILLLCFYLLYVLKS